MGTQINKWANNGNRDQTFDDDCSENNIKVINVQRCKVINMILINKNRKCVDM